MKIMCAVGVFLFSALMAAGPCSGAEDFSFGKYSVSFTDLGRINIKAGEVRLFEEAFLPVYVLVPNPAGTELEWGRAYTLGKYDINKMPDGKVVLKTGGTFEEKTDKGNIVLESRIEIAFSPQGEINFAYLMENKGSPFKGVEVVRAGLPDLSGQFFECSYGSGETSSATMPNMNTSGMHLANWKERISSVTFNTSYGIPITMKFTDTTSVMAGSGGANFYCDIFPVKYQANYYLPSTWKEIPSKSAREIKFQVILPQ